VTWTLNILQICPPHLPDVATLPSEIQVIFRHCYYIYFRLFTFAEKKTSSNCCSATLAVYLLLFSAFYYLHSPSTASGACYRRSASIDTDVLRLATAACCDMGWISAQRGVLRDRTVSKKTGSVLMQKVVTLNTCYNTACLTFQLPGITTGSF